MTALPVFSGNASLRALIGSDQRAFRQQATSRRKPRSPALPTSL
jgi:hypothetical protein